METRSSHYGDERIIASAVPPRLSWLTKNPTGDAEGFGASFTREVRHVGGYTLALLTGADPAGATRSLFRPATQRSIRFKSTCGVFTCYRSLKMSPWNVLVLVQVFIDLPDYRQMQKNVKV